MPDAIEKDQQDFVDTANNALHFLQGLQKGNIQSSKNSGSPATNKLSSDVHNNPLWIKCTFDSGFTSLSSLSMDLANHESDCNRVDLSVIDPDHADDFGVQKKSTVPVACCFVNPFTKSVRCNAPTSPQPCHGGILGDAMGLGKTIEMLSLIIADKQWMSNPHRNPSSIDPHSKHRATLVVCPTSVLSQWQFELTENVNQSYLRVLRYYGNNRSLDPDIASHVDVVLTTYGILVEEAKHIDKVAALEYLATSSSRVGVHEKSSWKQVASSGLFSVPWRRITLDEAHFINNRDTHSAQSVALLPAQTRWCLSGTIFLISTLYVHVGTLWYVTSFVYCIANGIMLFSFCENLIL